MDESGRKDRKGGKSLMKMFRPKTGPDSRPEIQQVIGNIEQTSKPFQHCHCHCHYSLKRADAAHLEEQKPTFCIPFRSVAKPKAIDTEPWYFGKITGFEAQNKLLLPNNKHGAFMIRQSQLRPNEYSLSIRNGHVVHHYPIRLRHKGGFFIPDCPTFPTLHDLVKYYSAHAHGLCVNLRKPCVRVKNGPNSDQSETNRVPFKFVHQLGRGRFGEVWEGLWKDTTPVAIQMLKRSTVNLKESQAETRIMMKLRHTKLIQYYTFFGSAESFYIVTELMKNGSLLEYLQGKGRNLKLHKLIDIAAQIASGMAYLESQNYIHRDLAARNVLVGEANIVKVAYFGLARIIKEEEDNAPFGDRSPIKWMAPEAAIHNRFSIKSDVWSFGILLTELISHGGVPYPTITDAQALFQVLERHRMAAPPNCPPALFAIMLETWHHDPMERPTFKALQLKLEDFFFNK